MRPPSSPRLAFGALLALAVVGCASAPPVVAPPEETQKVIKSGIVRVKTGNQGRLLGTLVADAAVLAWAGAPDLSVAQAQAFDQDGTPLTAPVKVDAQGHFILEGVRESRTRIFVEADLNGLRYRTLAPAPRERKDYGVTLDPGTTFLADKFRRSAYDKEILLEKIDEARLDETEDLVNTYMDETDRRDVLEQDDADLNAYAFDHFMDDHLPVKMAVYQLSASMLRGWKPNQPINAAPTPTPTPRPTPRPTPSGSPTPVPTPTGPAPK
jgi:hypothetical protein